MDAEQAQQARALNDEGRELWNRKAEFWDALHGDEGNRFHRTLVSPAVEKLLALQAGERVLDIACGSGVMARRLAQLGALVLAFGLGAYLIAVTSAPVERLTDIGLILGLMAAAVTLTRSLVKAEGRAEGYVMTCVALMFPLIARLANITFAGQPALMSPHMAAALATTAFSAFTVGLAAKTKWVSAQAFQWGSLTIACSVYVWAAFEGMPVMAEASVAAALGVVCVAALRVGARLNPELLEELVDWSIALCGALMARVCVIVLMTPDIGLDSGIATTIGLIAVSAGTSLVAVLSRWRIASILQWAWLLPAVAVYFGVASSNPMSQPWNIGRASALLTLAVASCVISWHRGGEADRSTLIGFSSAIVGLLFIRVFGLALLPWPWLISLAWASALYSSVASVACRRYRLEVLSPIGWASLVASTFFYFGAVEQLILAPAVDFSMILAVAISLAVAAFSTQRAESRGYWNLMVVLGWFVFSRLGVVSFLWSGMDIPSDQALSISWTAYALVLLGVGFARENQHLRYGGLFLLAATSSKVLLIDLASAPPSIRVLVTLGLGLAMLGGGYWYIRGRRPAQ